jgi:hypothetical protein
MKTIEDITNVRPKTVQLSKFPDFKVSPNPNTSLKSFFTPANK